MGIGNALLVLGVAAAAGYGGYVVGSSRRGSPADRPTPKYVRPGPGWYVLLYEDVGPSRPKGSLKDYKGPYVDKGVAVSVGTGERAGLWRGDEAAVKVQYMNRAPF